MSNSKIATPYKTNELDMVTFFENEILMKKLKNGGGEFQLSQGTFDQNHKTIKNQLFFPFRF